MSRLAAVHLSELRFGKFCHLKDVSQSFLAQSNPRESANLQSIKNRIHNMIFSHYAQESWNVTTWRLEEINFQVSSELRPWTSLAYSALPNSNCKLTRLGLQNFFREEIFQPAANFSSRFTNERDFYSFEFFFGFENLYICIYIYENLPVNAIVRLPYPRSGDS